MSVKCAKESKKPTQSKNWAFTYFADEDILKNYIKKIWKHPDNKECIRYICGGIEMCPTTGKKHIQGWIQTTTKRRMGGIKKILQSKKIHVESLYSTVENNEKYCKKDGNYITYGKFITQGQRTDLEQFINTLKETGGNLKKCALDNPDLYCRYRSGLKDIAAWIQEESAQDFRKLEVNVLYGPTGTGKTRTALKKCIEKTNEYPYIITGDQMSWWDGYDGQKAIIIDEYDSQITCTQMLNILDGYKLRLPIKGSHTWAKYTTVYITSNVPPSKWHSMAKTEHRKALMRRITNKTLIE